MSDSRVLKRMSAFHPPLAHPSSPHGRRPCLAFRDPGVEPLACRIHGPTNLLSLLRHDPLWMAGPREIGEEVKQIRHRAAGVAGYAERAANVAALW
jgi:hypothetical protein